MSFYPPRINLRFTAPQNAGESDEANAIGKSASFVCGAAMRWTLRIDAASKKIVDAKFQTNGCGYAMAAADWLAEIVIGKNLAELHGLDKIELRTQIELELGEFNAARKHCLDLTLETLQNAFANFRRSQIEEFAGEKALICTCFGVSEETIERIIKTKQLETVEEVTDACKAGGGCGSCQFLIQELIDSRENENF